MCKRKMEDARFEVETLEQRIPRLRGAKREEAMKTYRKILLSNGEKPIYLVRS